MWELIAQNKRKSFWLFVLMGLCLILLGYMIGAAYAPPNGGAVGIFFAGVIWFVLSLISYFAGDSIVLAVSGAREITQDVHPQLFNVVEEMKIAAALPATPKVYIMDQEAPNAFATGRDPKNSAIVVTAGLLSRLNRDQLQGVVAHETSHILNRDVLFMTFAGIMLGSIVLISEVFLRGLWFSGGSSRRYRSGSDRGGQGQAIIFVIAIVFAILAPILGRLLYFAISRRREYLADASAVRLTRYPEGLAGALEKISASTEPLPVANKVTAPMYICNPLRQDGMKISDLTSTHPPISERIRILRNIANGASFLEYQNSYAAVKGKENLIPASALSNKEAVPIRQASQDTATPPDTAKSKRDIGDLIRAVNGFAFLQCSCGLKIKVPPDFNKSSLACPKCGKEVTVPTAAFATAATALQAAASYTRKGGGWETFNCTCGNPLQISPAFEGTKVRCSKCGTDTEIKTVSTP